MSQLSKNIHVHVPVFCALLSYSNLHKGLFFGHLVQFHFSYFQQLHDFLTFYTEIIIIFSFVFFYISQESMTIGHKFFDIGEING